MQVSLLFSLLFLGSVNSFVPGFPKIIQNKKIEVFEPFYDNEEQKSVVFHTAVLNKVPNYVYSDLIYKMNDDNIKVIIPSSKNKKYFKDLNEDLTVVGHSSGAITAIEASKNKKVKNLVLIDPIDNRFLDKDDEDEDDMDLSVENLLLIYTKKSYDWSLFPFSMPFVPENLSLKENQLKLKNKKNKKVIEVSKFGHCDILDKTWADIADKSIAKGVDRRDDINKYHKWISGVIKSVAFDDSEHLENKSSFFKNYKVISPKLKKVKKLKEESECSSCQNDDDYSPSSEE
jgi:hypothetical protein